MNTMKPMTSRERVLKAIRHETPDRVPLDVWIGRPDVEKACVAKYGSLDAFYDAMRTDIYTAYTHAVRDLLVRRPGEKLRYPIDELSRLEFPDPSDSRVYAPHDHSRVPVQEAVEKYHGKGKAVFCHVWGVGESLQGLMGIENMMMCMATDREEMKRLFLRSGEWTAEVVKRVIAMGVDVVRFSDDWGSTRALMFSPKDWWELIYPADKIIVSAARSLNVPVALHSDGYIYDILPGIVEMGVNVLHPLQASAGMDQRKVKEEFGDRLCLYGGLDVTYTLPRGTDAEIRAEVVEKMTTLKPNGGYIFCTSHSVQEDTAIERVELAYRTAWKHSAY